MSDEIWDARFYAFREPGWHNLGYVSQERLTAEGALEKSRADYNINLRPLLVDLGGVQTTVEQHAIVRDPTADDPQYRVFGFASKGYSILQNKDIVRLVNPLTEKWPVETMGVLQEGMTFFMTLDAGEAEVKGTKIRQFFLVADTRSGHDAFDIVFTPVRVVCANTLQAGKAAAIATANLAHFGNLSREVELRVRLLKDMQLVQNKVMSSFEMMANAILTSEQLGAVIDSAYPYPRKPRKVTLAEDLTQQEMEQVGGLLEAVKVAERTWSVARDRADERRRLAWDRLHHFNGEEPQNADTAWAAYNAVVEVEDYRAKEPNEEALLSALFGTRARTKQRAYGIALGAAKGEDDFALVEREVSKEIA